MGQSPGFFVGIDLGTTNSAAAVFDGDKVLMVRNSAGSTLTPSVVRMDGRGLVTVGARARRFLESDPENTRAEFKRLMGTSGTLAFAQANTARSPEQLAAEILRSLRADIQEQLGFAPTQAVVSVPALFELPQGAATAKAAALAGFDRVEMIQEPVASALAAGWTRDEGEGLWLVYDLGGGTFDASLLESADGMLRVVGHDGDNFLGGRDVDLAIVDWALGQLNAQHGTAFSRSDPALAPAVRKLKAAAEEAKVELSRNAQTVLAAPALLPGPAGALDVDLMLSQEVLQGLCAAWLERSVEVCQRLLETHGVVAGKLSRVVLVGGPTVMPFLRQRVAAALGAPLAEGLDPMTLVAQGAALHAASSGLDARPPATVQEVGCKLWLKHPAVSSDLMPFVAGRVLEATEAQAPVPATITLLRADGGFKTAPVPVDAQGAFVLQVELQPRKTNVFSIQAAAADGSAVAVSPAVLTMVQGLTVSDPPLSRSIGVALASDRVKVFFDKGAPLPARRSARFQTVESVAKGTAQSILTIPIVQGEYGHAHLCRLVGSLHVDGATVSHSLPAGSDVEVTLEVDRSGTLSARALVPATGQVFEQVARLMIPTEEPAALEASMTVLRERMATMRTNAFRQGSTRTVSRLGNHEAALADVARDITAARGGDADAAQKARRSLLELDALLDGLENEKRWPELDAEARRKVAVASSWVSEHGTDAEKVLLVEVQQAIARARAGKQMLELERQLRVLADLQDAAFFRDPDAWRLMFEDAAGRVEEAMDLPQAQTLVVAGRQALARSDHPALRAAVQGLWRLLPPDAAHRRMGFDSGIR